MQRFYLDICLRLCETYFDSNIFSNAACGPCYSMTLAVYLNKKIRYAASVIYYDHNCFITWVTVVFIFVSWFKFFLSKRSVFHKTFHTVKWLKILALLLLCGNLRTKFGHSLQIHNLRIKMFYGRGLCKDHFCSCSTILHHFWIFVVHVFLSKAFIVVCGQQCDQIKIAKCL